jgi:hypothetical protein
MGIPASVEDHSDSHDETTEEFRKFSEVRYSLNVITD